MNADKKLTKQLNSFLDKKTISTEKEESISTDEVLLPSKSGIVEKINKKLITEDGRQLILS